MAIQFNAFKAITSSIPSGGNTLFTTSGTDIFLFIVLYSLASQGVTGCTYGGVAMTQIDTVIDGYNNDYRMTTFGLMNAPSGANNISPTFSGGGTISLWGGSYNGVATVGQPRTFGKYTSPSANNFPITLITQTGEWMVAVNRNNSAVTMLSGTTARAGDSNTGLVDSGGILSPDSNTIGVNCSPLAGGTIMGITLVAPAVSNKNFLMFL